MSDPIASTSTSASPPEDDGFSAPITHRKPARAPKHRKNKAPTRPRERTLAERVESRLGPMQATNYLDKCAGKSPLSAWPNTCGRCAVLTAALWLVVAELVEKALAGAGEGEAGPCPRPEDLVCLGLGSVSDSTKSQDQFHLLQTMRKVLAKDLKSKATVFDPVFAPEDVAFFTEHDYEPLTAEHPLTLDCTTLLYMPHCPRSLFNLLLERNWSPERLRRLILVGNRLDMYDDPTHPSARSKETTPFITKGAPLFELLPLPPDKRHLESFNDLALQWVPESKLAGLPDDFWPPATAATGAPEETDKADVKETLEEELERLSI